MKKVEYFVALTEVDGKQRATLIKLTGMLFILFILIPWILYAIIPFFMSVNTANYSKFSNVLTRITVGPFAFLYWILWQRSRSRKIKFKLSGVEFYHNNELKSIPITSFTNIGIGFRSITTAPDLDPDTIRTDPNTDQLTKIAIDSYITPKIKLDGQISILFGFGKTQIFAYQIPEFPNQWIYREFILKKDKDIEDFQYLLKEWYKKGYPVKEYYETQFGWRRSYLAKANYNAYKWSDIEEMWKKIERLNSVEEPNVQVQA
jgi:hypothetical protein